MTPGPGTAQWTGWYQLTVTSPAPPDPTAVPAQRDPQTGQGQIVKQLFPDATQVVGGSYSYTYNQVDGSKYTQTG